MKYRARPITAGYANDANLYVITLSTDEPPSMLIYVRFIVCRRSPFAHIFNSSLSGGSLGTL